MHIPSMAMAHRPLRINNPDMHFEVLNPPPDFRTGQDPTEYFSLTAGSNTRLVRASLANDDLTAPMVLRRLRHPFVLCEVTVSGDFVQNWDQGGLVIFLGGHPAHNQYSPARRLTSRRRLEVIDPELSRPSPKWARVALELENGELGISTLVANPKCGVDWASTPAFPSMRSDEASEVSLRLKLERVGYDLWVWFTSCDQQMASSTQPSVEHVRSRWRKCREIVNFFDEQSTKGDAWVGCYASRPVPSESDDPHDGLFVEFEDLEIL